jgi:hypothetical protein
LDKLTLLNKKLRKLGMKRRALRNAHYIAALGQAPV